MIEGVELRDNKLALERLYDYFIREANADPIPFGAWEKISLFLELLGGSGGIYSWPPAKQYGHGKPTWLDYSIQVTNPLSNTLFLVKATDDLFNSIATELTAPGELSDIIKLPSKKDLAIKYSKITLGSLVCAIPFGIVTYLFPLPGCDAKACIAAMVTHSTVANTILHAISWNLILTPEFWYYRLPLIPFEKAWSYLQSSCMTDQQRNFITLQHQKEAIYQKYRNHIGQYVVNGSQKIVADYIRNRNDENGAYTLRQITDKATMRDFSNFVGNNDLLQASSESTLFATLKPIHRFLQNYGVPSVGAALIVAGCIGLICNPIYVGMQEKLSLGASIALGILPSYSTAVLCAFYGAAVLGQVYQYLTTWEGGIAGKLSLESRLNLGCFLLFMLFNLYVSAFAFGTAEALIETVFKSNTWDDVRGILQYIAIPALQILSFIPLLNLFDTVTRNCIAKFSADSDDKKAARLLVKSNIFNQRLQQVDGNALMTNLAELNKEKSDKFNLDEQELSDDLQTLRNLEEQIEKPMANESHSNRYSWFSVGKTSEEEHAGLLGDNYKAYQS